MDPLDPADPPGAPALELLAVELARGAADYVAGHRADAASVTTKSTDTDLVTAADAGAERWLRKRIAALRPADAVLGEEAGASGGASGVRWIVDPIDGTVNFVLGLPQYAVSVAAEVAGTVLAGAVVNAATGETFSACRGGGARCDGQELGARRSVPLERAVIGTGFGYEAGRRTRQARIVTELLPRIADIRRLGAASLDLCAVAAGRLDGYFEAGLNVWDYAAGALVAQESGARVSGLRGRGPHPGFVAAAAPDLAESLFAVLTELDADAVLG